jgi:two-component system, chemotaxis family, sensor kinase CheA
VSALQEQFVAEARELIRQATDDLIALERAGGSPERIDGVFRAFHTLKGSAGVVELPAMSVMLHAAEDLLAGVRAGTLRANAEVIDAALACLDQVSRWVDDFEATGSLPPQAGADGRAMAERLRSLLPASESRQPGSAVQEAAAGVGEGAQPEWVARQIAADRKAIVARLPERPWVATAISYEPIASCFYNGDDPLHLMRQIPDLLAFDVEPRETFLPLADLDPYACNLRLRAISAGDRDEIARIFRLVPDQVHIIDVPPAAVLAAETPPLSDDQALTRKVIEAQCDLLRVANRGDDFAGCVGAAARVAANALRHGGHLQIAQSVARAGALALARHDAGPLLAALEQAMINFVIERSPATAEGGDRPGGATANAAEGPTERVLRVSETKIEALVNLAGELVVAKNALTHSARRVEQDIGPTDHARSIQRDRDAIERLVTELHGTILQLRMVPVAQLFRSFPRLVRDIARQLDKNVTLVTRGETTEADKTIVDRLFEPVLHLVRNALDHGVENPGQRRAAGKSETATISITALRVADRLMVEVSDDGRGIDPQLVRRKAFENRILPADELAELPDERVVDLVFSAGFSTASAVSDLSGRGIGMDVVRAAIEQIGGRVSLESKVGVGTKVRLDLPMTIAMSRIMVVETAGQLFGISMDAVSETVRVTADRISRIKGNVGFVLRDRVVPIVSLAERLKLPERTSDVASARLLLVMEAAGRIAAVEIDAIRDRLDVVLKPMQGLLAGARGYAGTTLLGNGEVLLVLDMKEILP